MKKTLLIVIDQLGVGGTERQLTEILPRLKKDNYTIIVYALSSKGQCADILSQNNIQIIPPPFYKTLLRCGPIGRGLLLFCSMCKLTVLILRIKPRLIHYYLPKAYLVGSICAFLTSSRKLVMSRRSLNTYQRKHPLLASFERKLHRRMSMILANSKSVFEQLQNDEDVSKDRMRIIYNGVDTSKFSKKVDTVKLRSDMRISENSLVFIIVANLFPYKGHADLLKALFNARNDLPDNWVLLCVGRDENILKDLKQQSKEYAIEEHIRWLGKRNDVPELLLSSDIALLCSHEEGFSNSILEAMAAKLPLIVTDVGGNTEAVIDGVSGIVVPPKNPKALSKAICRLASDKQLRINMGRAGFQQVQERFSLERCVDSYDAIYSELMG